MNNEQSYDVKLTNPNPIITFTESLVQSNTSFEFLMTEKSVISTSNFDPLSKNYDPMSDLLNVVNYMSTF